MEIYQESVDWQILKDLLLCATEVGIDITDLGIKLGYNLSLEEMFASSVTTLESYSLLDRRLADAIRKEIYNQAGFEGMSLKDYEILFHYMLGAKNLHEALERVPVFTSLVPGRLRNARLGARYEGESVVMSLDWGVGDAQAKYGLMFFYELIRFIYIMEWMIGRSLEIKAIGVPFEPGALPAETLERFQCPVRFLGRCYTLTFSKKSFSCPIVRSLDQLQSFLKVFPAIAVVSSDFGKLSERISRMLISQGLAGQPLLSALEVSNVFNVSEATMRRRLSKESTNYAQIRRECQLKLACHFLESTHYDVGAISYQVGFSDEAAFRRAFKSWTGKTPAEYRSECLASA